MSIPLPPAGGPRPLFPAAIHGIRAWRVDDRGILYGAGRGSDWRWAPGGEATVACCEATVDCPESGSHSPPDPDCGCGLYGVHLGAAGEYVPEPGLQPLACGVIEAWGRVELHEDGFRAEFARPVALLVPPRPLTLPAEEQRLLDVAGLYRAEPVRMPKLRHLADWCRRRGFGLAPGVVQRLVAARA